MMARRLPPGWTDPRDRATWPAHLRYVPIEPIAVLSASAVARGLTWPEAFRLVRGGK